MHLKHYAYDATLRDNSVGGGVHEIIGIVAAVAEVIASLSVQNFPLRFR